MANCGGDAPVFVNTLAFHDGNGTAYLRSSSPLTKIVLVPLFPGLPGGPTIPTQVPLVSGDALPLRSATRAYNGPVTVTVIGGGWYSLSLPYADIREELDTAVRPQTIAFGAGDDALTIAGNEQWAPTLTGGAGTDTLAIAGFLAPTATLVPERVVNRDVDVTYTGFEQLNLLDPTADLTLAGAAADGPIDVGPLGVGVVARQVTLPVDFTGGALELNTAAAVDLAHAVQADSLKVRVFGDGQGITVANPLVIGDLIELTAPDGTVALPGGTQLTTATAVIKARTLTTPANQLDLAVDTLTIVTPPTVGNDLQITNAGSLTLTNAAPGGGLVPLDAAAAGVFAGVTWVQSAPAEWAAQVFDGGANPYALAAHGLVTVSLPAADSVLTVRGAVAAYAGHDLRLTADEMDFFGGPGSLRGSGELTVLAASDPWTYRLGTAAETGGGDDVQGAGRAGTLDLTTRDLAVLADGYSRVTIGRGTAGNEMRIGDAFAMTVVKATQEPRVVDASWKDQTWLLADTFVVEGDARAPLDR